MKTLRFWVLPNEGFRTMAGLAELLRDFHRDRPDLRVETRVRTAAQIWSDLMLLAKRPHDAEQPDLVQIPYAWTSSLAELDQIRDLGALDAQLTADRAAPFLTDHCHLAGTKLLHSLPWWFDVRLLVYRPAAFRRAKVEPALLGTWEGFREACARLAQSKTIIPLGNHHPRYAFSIEDVAPRVWARGGDFLSRDGRRCIFQREEGQRGAADYLELWTQGWMPLPGGDGLTPGTIFEGSCAMQFSGRMPRDPDVSWVAYPGDGPTVAVAQHLAIPSASVHSREALDLLKFLVDPRRQQDYAERLGALPAAAESLESAIGAEGASGGALARSIERARSLPNSPLMATLERIFSRFADSLLRHVLRKSYRTETLRQELVHAAAEMDYVFQLSA